MEKGVYMCDYREDFDYKEDGVHIHLHNMDFPDMHYHNYWEFFVVTEGRSQHILNGQKLDVKKNDFYLIRPNDVHCFKKRSSENSQQLNVMITDKQFKLLADSFSAGLYDDIIAGRVCLASYLDESTINMFLNTLHLIQALPTGCVKEQVTLIRSLYFDALKIVYSNSLTYDHRYPQWLNDFLVKMRSPQYIDQRVEDVYRLTNFSHIHLSRLFKHYMNETLIDYLKRLKLEYSAMLLRTTNFKLVDISNQVGYSSLSHFLRVFKAMYGITPTQYRKKSEQDQ